MPSTTHNHWRLPATGLLLSLVILATLTACGGDDGGTSPSGSGSPDETPILTPIDATLLPIVISSDLAVGPGNRFQIGLINQDEGGTQVLGADLHLRFFKLQGTEGTLKFEADAEPIVLTKNYSHTHEDGFVESHEAGETGVYVTYVEFDEPGDWGVEVTGATAEGEALEPLRPTFTVSQAPFGLAIGDPAPRTVQPLAADVDDIRDIDTSTEPIEEQHNLTIADAVTSGRPTVIAFSTPAFCQTQVCGPAKEVFDDLYDAYKDDANFVHIEPYDVARMRNGECTNIADCLVPAVNDFRLQTEPWIIVVDAEGNIAAKIDGITSYEEVEAALQATLG